MGIYQPQVILVDTYSITQNALLIHHHKKTLTNQFSRNFYENRKKESDKKYIFVLLHASLGRGFV
jgi:coproporphyrinogen III oxidase